MRISAIIVAYHAGAVLMDCLAALAHAAELHDIVLVENGADAHEAKRVDRALQHFPRFRVLRGHGNVGFARGCNMGAAAAEGDALLFVNPDAIVADGAIAALAATLENARQPAIVGAMIVGEDGHEQRGARRDELTLWRAFVSATGLSRFERFHPSLREMHRERDPLPARAIEVGAISGACMLMRRLDFGALGGFDENYFLHVDDLDICRRARAAGGVVLFEPGARVMHVGATSRAAPGFVRRRKAESFVHYFTKFAANPIERALSRVLGGAILVLLRLRAGLSARRRG